MPRLGCGDTASSNNSRRGAGLPSPRTRRLPQRQLPLTAAEASCMRARLDDRQRDSRRVGRVPRQNVVELRERRPRRDEDVSARPSAGIAVQEAGRNVPVTLVVRDGGNGRAAAPAERPLERCRRAVMNDLVRAVEPAERRARNAEARAEQAAMVLAAHRAVAVREPPIRRRDAERDRAAEASTANARAHAACATRAGMDPLQFLGRGRRGFSMGRDGAVKPRGSLQLPFRNGGYRR